MLETQKFLTLNNLNFTALTDAFSIKVNKNKDGRVILNYSQFDSPKEEKIVTECRSLTLSTDGTLIAKAFDRFFNCGELLSFTKKFRWDMDIRATDKLDGSLIQVYYWKGHWRIQARNSFSESKPDLSPYTWKELVHRSIPLDFWTIAPKQFNYVFELCTPYNKVVQNHTDFNIYLLACFNQEQEILDLVVDEIAKELELKRPKKHVFRDLMDVQAYIARQVDIDKTFEGVVLQDINGMRLKVKSPKYIELSHRFNNGNIRLNKYLVPAILDGEKDEILEYFPEVKEQIRKIEEDIQAAWTEVESYWYCFKDESNQKKFALAIANCKYKAALFTARKNGVQLKDVWTKDLILKLVFGV